MATSPDDLRNKTFTIVKKGYERGEVHRFLGSIADELSAFNANEKSNNEIIVADVVQEDEPEIVSFDEPEAIDDEPVSVAPSATEQSTTTASATADDFDRMGNEISLMLRQAQESAIKIRGDAEIEARTLVDQVRLDIESDRLAHEQAAAELITRTEERAATLRTEAEEYAQQTRQAADSYAEQQRAEADQLQEAAAAAAKADRDSAEEALASANTSAEATIANAEETAATLIKDAESKAQTQADEILADATSRVASLTDAEKDSRANLEQARSTIESALAQLDSGSAE